jgi:hypothetical protein
MITAVSAAALEHKDLIIKLATHFRLPVVYAYRTFCGSRPDELRNRHYWTVQTRCRLRHASLVQYAQTSGRIVPCRSALP